MSNVTLEIGGKPTSVTIDGFENMSADEKQASVGHVAQDIMTKRAAAPSPGGSADANGSYANDLGQGARDLEGGVRATARLADMLPDGTPGKQTISDFGHAPQAFPAPAGGYTPATGRFTDAVRQGD